MNASEWEQDLAASKGVTIRHWLRPLRVLTEGGRVTGIELEYTALEDGRLAGTGETATIATDQVFRALGQAFVADPLGGLIAPEGGRLRVEGEGGTYMPKRTRGV